MRDQPRVRPAARHESVQGQRPKAQARHNATVVLRWLAVHASERGRSSVSYHRLAEILQLDRSGYKTIERTLDNLEKWGCVRLVGIEERRSFLKRDDEELPGYVRVHPDLRAQTTKTALAEFEATRPT